MASIAQERRSICLPDFETHGVLQSGHPKFMEELTRLSPAAENNALESVIQLKARLSTLPSDQFWNAATEGMAEILGSDMSFIFKRILVDDALAAVEMPPYGEPGSCLMAAAFHYCSNDGSKTTVKESKFSAYGCPCAYMRHDKVFLIPENLNTFITNNPNKLPTPAEAYMAVPLFAEGKCFAHFGAMWSKERASIRKLSWAFIEMLLHSLEDMIQHRLLQGANFTPPSPPPERPRLIPHDAVTVAQSLQPCSVTLPHELTTPIKGIVGMLNVMHTNVQEAVDTQVDPKLRKIFEDLKEKIEIVQDRSRRAAEAVDTVVGASETNMQPVFLTTNLLTAGEEFEGSQPGTAVADGTLSPSRKRKREDDATFGPGILARNDSKFQKLERARNLPSSAIEPNQEAIEDVQSNEEVDTCAQHVTSQTNMPIKEDIELATSVIASPTCITAPVFSHTDRHSVETRTNEQLDTNSIPEDLAFARETETPLVETIEIRSRGSDGISKIKWIEWSITPTFPQHTTSTHDRDLTSSISSLILNTLRFAENKVAEEEEEEGEEEDKGGASADLIFSGDKSRVTVKVSSSESGHPASYLPKQFHKFSSPHESQTRQHSKVSGLGVQVTKAVAKKVGGELIETNYMSWGTWYRILTT